MLLEKASEILNPAYIKCSPKGWETSSSYYLEGREVSDCPNCTFCLLPENFQAAQTVPCLLPKKFSSCPNCTRAARSVFLPAQSVLILPNLSLSGCLVQA